MGALIAVTPASEGVGQQGKTLNTSDATLTLVAELTVPNAGVLQVTATWTACDPAATNSFSGNVFATARAPAGIAILDTPAAGDGFTRLSSGWSAGAPATRPSVTFVGGVDKFFRVYAKGRAATTIYWTFDLQYLEVLTP